MNLAHAAKAFSLQLGVRADPLPGAKQLFVPEVIIIRSEKFKFCSLTPFNFKGLN